MDVEENNRRSEAINKLFSLWDLDGNGFVGYHELMQILQSSLKLSNPTQMKAVKRFEANLIQARTQSKRGSQAHLNLPQGGSVAFDEVNGEPTLDPKAFTSFLLSVMSKAEKAEFDDFLEVCASAVVDAQQSTQGSQQKKELWEIFQMLDSNHDGYVDMDEIEVLLECESKADRKQIMRWKHYLQTRAYEERRNPDGEEELQEDPGLKLTLADFHKFVNDYVENRQERITQILEAMRKQVQEKQVAYIVQFKVHEVINDIMDDLLRERPQDVLEGIKKSVERLQRTYKYPKPVNRK